MENPSIDQGTNSILATFAGRIPEPDFKVLAEAILTKVQTSGMKKLLYDTTKLEVMAPTIQEWINNYWFPKAIKLGVSHMAFIVPSNIFGQVSMEETNKKESVIKIKYFKSMDEAKSWIKAL